MDLVLGLDRLNLFPPIDEYDFFEGNIRIHRIMPLNNTIAMEAK